MSTSTHRGCGKTPARPPHGRSKQETPPDEHWKQEAPHSVKKKKKKAEAEAAAQE
jgi:hypothetical protein